ncbi:chromate efflux transporter [Planomonospora sp. ID67723]|nr:chromate efflux transporter [Planomonospora sp. ID67723]
MGGSYGGAREEDRGARPGRALAEVIGIFLKLGVIGFGGPAAHTAMMRDELVRRRGWVSDERFVDLMGATNLIPGPNSTELAIHLGHERARWRGLIAAGVCFILPAFAIVLALAWAYTRYGRTPAAEGLLYGIKPVVVAIVVWALAGLLKTAVKGRLTGLVAAAALAAYLLGVDELLVLAAGGLLVMAVRTGESWLPRGGAPALFLPLLGDPRFPDPTGGQLTQLFLNFLKIGSVLYGSGYVLLAFLEGDFVERLGWITGDQLLDAISIGQVTPGPVFTTATFIGYVVAGLPGAVLATVGIFAPSFVFVGLLTRVVDRIRDRAWSSAFLDGVNATALALMAGVTIELAGEAFVDPLTVGLAVLALLLQWRTKLNTAWFIAVAAVIGLARVLIMQ